MNRIFLINRNFSLSIGFFLSINKQFYMNFDYVCFVERQTVKRTSFSNCLIYTVVVSPKRRKKFNKFNTKLWAFCSFFNFLFWLKDSKHTIFLIVSIAVVIVQKIFKTKVQKWDVTVSVSTCCVSILVYKTQVKKKHSNFLKPIKQILKQKSEATSFYN